MNAAADPDVFEAAVEAGPPPPVALAELASALWRRKGLILACGAAALLLAGAVLSRLPDRYVAQAEVLLEARAPRVVEFDQVLPAAPFDAQAVQSEIRLIQSQQLLSRVARKLRLAEVEEFSGRTAGAALPARLSAGLRERARELARTWLGWTPAAAPAPAPDQADRRAVAELRRRLDVRQQDLSRVIAVRMTSADAATAALLANAVADQYIVDQLEAKFEATERAAAWLTERLTGISARLERAEAEAEALRARLAADPASARSKRAEMPVSLSVSQAAARSVASNFASS
ncbi:MAG: Wzz/FepE/Etk N-terminal domain-containing protein [Pseudomonadota bacterium]